MSVFGSNIITKLTTDLFAFGATIDGSGAVTAITGASLEYVTAAPTATRNGGSLALRSDGSLYATAGGGVWILIGGSGSGWNLPNDVAGVWGTTSPKQVSSVYVSASNRFDLVGTAQSGATAVTNPDMRIATGAQTITGAVAGSPSGFLQLLTGASDCTNAGGTGGDTGAISLTSGSATSTAGTSGSSGSVSLISGNSDDANSGNIVLTTGSAAGTRGVLDINATNVDLTTQATQIQLIDNTVAALQIGSLGALDMMVFTSSNAGEEIVVNAVSGIRAANNVAFIAGNTADDRFSFSYVSLSNQGQLAGTSISAGGATQATRPLAISTGSRTLVDAAGSPASGAITFLSGNAEVNFAGGGATGGSSGSLTLASGNTDVLAGANTGGNTGSLLIESGNAAATAGTSGSSGSLTLRTGTTVNGSSGNLSISTGNVSGGTGNSGSIAISAGTSAGGTRGNVAVTGLLTSSNTASAITAARTLTLADSGGKFLWTQAAGNNIVLPNPTTGAGLTFEFVVGTASANTNTITIAAGATFIGYIINDTTSVIPATGGTLSIISGTAAVGDTIVITSVSTGLYAVKAVTSAAGGITIA